jgi:hypothetical protein
MQIVRRSTPPLIVLLALVAAAPAAASPKYQVTEVGVDNAEKLAGPGCPDKCQAIGQVTGYQSRVGSERNPYTIKRNGRITAFTIALGKPTRKQTTFFTNLYGAPPSARLSILKVPKKGRELRLTAQSEVFNLTPYLGSKPTFALERSLDVTPKSIVALTVPTWAPAFSVDLARSMRWRSSRTKCNDVQQPAAQQTINSVRKYACGYKTARLLYSATFVRDPKPRTEQNDRDN